jgi:hypothetical protein
MLLLLSIGGAVIVLLLPENDDVADGRVGRYIFVGTTTTISLFSLSQ